MARAAGHATYAWCALSSDDAGENRALASNAQEPHPARELLSARRSRSSKQCIRRVLQPPALSREHRQSHPGRRLLRARSNDPTAKRKDQTQDHPKPSVASPQTSRVTSTMMRQTLSWFTPPPVSKSLTTDSITTQLIDALTGAHRWAERYDRNLEDVFTAQDEV